MSSFHSYYVPWAVGRHRRTGEAVGLTISMSWIGLLGGTPWKDWYIKFKIAKYVRHHSVPDSSTDEHLEKFPNIGLTCFHEWGNAHCTAFLAADTSSTHAEHQSSVGSEMVLTAQNCITLRRNILNGEVILPLMCRDCESRVRRDPQILAFPSLYHQHWDHPALVWRGWPDLPPGYAGGRLPWKTWSSDRSGLKFCFCN